MYDYLSTFYSILIRYYSQNWKLLLIMLIVSNILTFVILNSNFMYGLIGCLLSGKGPECFRTPSVTRCQVGQIGHVYGWCNDPQNLGPLEGDRTGPYNGYCYNWYWSECPPEKCSDIGKPEYKGRLGWCQSYNVALKGEACGPTGVKCPEWKWDVAECQKCQSTRSNMKPKTESDKPVLDLEKVEPDNLICGKINGKDIPCPNYVDPDKVKHCKLTCGKISDNGKVNCPPSCNAYQDADADKCQCPGDASDSVESPWWSIFV